MGDCARARATLCGSSSDSDVELSQAHHNCVMTKDPRYSSLTNWHRDIRYWSFERPELVSVWLALGRERDENGCLLVLPGTHAMDFAPHQLDDAQFLRTDAADNRRAARHGRSRVELDPGDVLFFHCRLFHAAGRNQTDETKFSVVYTYHAADNRPLRRHPLRGPPGHSAVTGRNNAARCAAVSQTRCKLGMAQRDQRRRRPFTT